MSGTETRATTTPAHVDFDSIDCPKILFSGVRHLVRGTAKPTRGEVVKLVDGALYKVPWLPRQSPHIYGCSACAEVHLEEHPPPKPDLKPEPELCPVPSPRRRRPYVDYEAEG